MAKKIAFIPFALGLFGLLSCSLTYVPSSDHSGATLSSSTTGQPSSSSSISESSSSFAGQTPTTSLTGKTSVSFDKSVTRIDPLNYVNQKGPAPVYSLWKYSDQTYGVLTERSIAKNQECLTYREVAEYYSMYQTWPVNYKRSTSEALAYGKNGRVVSSYYSGESHQYDYTVMLGTFNQPSGGLYYEFDIDLTGNYNTGNSISRGAGRVVAIVDGISDYGDKPVCYYTSDHYADFIEYYNYDGGWSPLFKGIYNKSGSYENTPTASIARPTPATVSYALA